MDIEGQMRESNIFYNILKNEVTLTEIFCNLMSYEAFRAIFIDLVNQKRDDENKLNHQSIQYNDFSTEKNFGEIKECFEEDENNKIGRGDLILNYNDEDYIFEIKIEIYTGLTKNQPKGYLCYLKQQNQKNYNEYLYFILPKRYMHFDQIIERWDNYPKEIIQSNHILYWEDILNEIRKKELDKLNIIIKEFCEILDYRWFYTKPIHFTNNEIELIFQQYKAKYEEPIMPFNGDIPTIMRKIFDVIEGCREKFEYIKKYDEQQPNLYGYQIDTKKYNIVNGIDIWFGTDYEIWKEEAIPLMIQVLVDNNDDLEEYINELLGLQQYRYEKDDEGIAYFIPLNKDYFDKENIIELFVSEIHNIIEKLRKIPFK